MSLLDMDEVIIAIAKRVEVVYGPLVDAQEFPKAVDVAVIEGAISSQDDLERVRTIRQRSKLVVALGDCAVTGNVPPCATRLFPRKTAGAHLYRRRRRKPGDSHRGRSRAAAPCHPGARSGEGGSVRARLSAVGRVDCLRAGRVAGRPRAGSEFEGEIWLRGKRHRSLTMAAPILAATVRERQGTVL
jgi:hypothetical protein